MATITNRDGKYRVQIRLCGVSKSKTFTRLTDAKAWASKIESEIRDGINGNAGRHFVFWDLLDRYAAEISPTKRGSQSEIYRINRAKNTDVAKIKLDDLKPSDFAKWRDTRLTQVSSSSVSRELSTLSAVCEYAMKEWGLLKDNPVKKIKKPPSAKERTRRPTQKEIDDICEALLYDPNTPPTLTYQRVAMAFLFAIETAMRAGEICSLTWENIHFERRIAHLPITKNGHSRDVPLSSRAIALLNQLKGIDELSVFALNAQSLDVIFRRVRDRLGIKDLHFHDSRREALTRLSKKVPVETLAKISGHRDLSILLNVYYRPDMAEIADLLD
nr:MAG TPA: Integrase [Bacteriophage sp.]